MNLNKQVSDLLNKQIKQWELARNNYQALSSTKTKIATFNDLNITVQFNPERIRSSRAKLDAQTLAKRPCFLCDANLPSEQLRLDAGEYYILVNPYPIFPEHFTIPRKGHTAQQIKPFFKDMLKFARDMDQYIVFYNGPQCGASAPDHMHFQAGSKKFLPLIEDYKRLKPTRGKLMQETQNYRIYGLSGYLRTVICIESSDMQSACQAFNGLYSQWQTTDTEEPMMNIVCNYENGIWYTFLFPRKEFRPWQYYTKEAEKQLLVSPATVEMSGIFITPVQEHFEKISPTDIADILKQASLTIQSLEFPEEPVIQVGIMYQTGIDFILNGDFSGPDGKHYSGRYTICHKQNNIVFEDKTYQTISFQPLTEDAAFDLQDVVIGIDFHWERKENQRFKGNLKFITENGKITAINEIKVEDYLTSVISSEMSATASEELLKAHAIISRSWLLANLHHTGNQNNVTHQTEEEFIKWYERDAHKNFHVCADDHCQRYQGITRASTPTVEKAITLTRGEVLVFNNQICDARFSKSCGGISETFENAWDNIPHPYLTKVVDNPRTPDGFNTDLTVEKNAEAWVRQSPPAFCNTRDKKILSQVLNNYDQETTDFYRWQIEYTQKELADLIRKKSGFDFGEIIDLTSVQRGISGRIIKLKITGTRKTLTVGKELEIRKWLSESHLYSSAFIVDKLEIKDGIPQRFRFTGAGWGHGVGLCQIGAAVMAEKGYTYREILSHYFHNTQIEKIY